jgi:hypothetical protein
VARLWPRCSGCRVPVPQPVGVVGPPDPVRSRHLKRRSRSASRGSAFSFLEGRAVLWGNAPRLIPLRFMHCTSQPDHLVVSPSDSSALDVEDLFGAHVIAEAPRTLSRVHDDCSPMSVDPWYDDTRPVIAVVAVDAADRTIDEPAGVLREGIGNILCRLPTGMPQKVSSFAGQANQRRRVVRQLQ